MDLGIAGKRVLITGASQGIGRAIALDFARENCQVSLIARREKMLQQVVEEMGGAERGHNYYVTDLLEEGAPTRAVRKLSAGNAPFDIVVHNLGGTLQVKDPLSPMEQWRKVWQFNVGVAIEMNALLIPPMQANGWGRVVHISSISAENLRGSGPYGAAKAYLNAYTKVLARGIAQTGVVVSAVLPGAIIAEGGHWDNIRKTNPAMMADFLRHHHAVGRLGTAEEIAPFVLFMASEHVTFGQGALINVDGGTM
jgi:3-oxoacyl-[acyl-carrier protein] reductase